MSSLDEKRRFAAGADTTTALVATGVGLARVAVAGDRVGETGIVRRCDARDLAAGDGQIALAADEGVVVATGPAELAETDPAPIGTALDASAFGSPMAVGIHDGAVLAADASGTVVRGASDHGSEPGHGNGTEWTRLGEVETVAAIDGDLVASAGGVHRVVDGDLRHAGLDAVRDVAGAVVPHAATRDGLYRLANGWIDVLNGDLRMVTIDPETADTGGLGRAHAATAETCYAHEDGEWHAIEVPIEEPIADVAYAGCVYAITAGGTLLADDGDGWRRHVLGLTDASAIAVVPEPSR